MIRIKAELAASVFYKKKLGWHRNFDTEYYGKLIRSKSRINLIVY